MPTAERLALNQANDTIEAVLDFARKLERETPERLRLTFGMNEEEWAVVCAQLGERDRIAAQLLRLLEECGIDIHSEE